jgi:hypothetical protein
LSQNTSNIYELQTREYDYIDGNHTVGLIAEEVNIIDAMLTTKDNGITPTNINWNALQTYMVKELQKLRNEIDSLKNKKTELKNRKLNLENKLK